MSIAQDRGSGPKQELELRVTARRNKLLGLWAAERMGMIGEAAAEYVLGLVRTEANNNRSDSATVKKVCADMDARGYPIGEDDVGRQLAVFAKEARAEILRGPESKS